MSPLIRSVGGGLAGAVTAFVVILLMQQLTLRMYPLPAGLDVSDPEALRAYAATLPLGAFLMVLLGYAVAALAGGFVAAAVGRGRRPALLVAALLVFASIVNLRTIPHPAWFWAANLLVVGLLPLAGAALAGPSRAAAATSH